MPGRRGVNLVNRRKDVSLWVLMVVLAGSLFQFLFSGQRGPVALFGMAAAFIGLVVAGGALLKQRKQSKS
jgi:hypothetical protein